MGWGGAVEQIGKVVNSVFDFFSEERRMQRKKMRKKKKWEKMEKKIKEKISKRYTQKS